MIPKVKLVTDGTSKITYVQLPSSSWDDFVEEYKSLKQALDFKDNLKKALQEVRDIEGGRKKGITGKQLLDEL